MYAVERLLEDPAARSELTARLADNSTPPRLRDAKLKVTSRCNLACRMCDYWRTTREQTLDLDAWRQLLDELAGLGCAKVHVSGGEPFLRPDLNDILSHGVSRGLKVNLTTNGTVARDDQLRRLVDDGVHAVSISLDGPNAKIHDAIRGRPGAFKKSLRSIRRLVRDSARREARLRVRVNFVLMNDNFRKLPAMIELAGELGAVDLVPMPVDGFGLQLSRRQLEAFNAEVAPEAARLRSRYGFQTNEQRLYPFGQSSRDLSYARLGRYARGQFERQSCYAPWLHSFIGWNGDVALCCMTSGSMEPLGNVRDRSLTEVLSGDRARKVRADFLAGRMLPQCHSCDLFGEANEKLAEVFSAVPRARRRLVVLKPTPPTTS